MREKSQVLECMRLRAQGRSIRAIAKSLKVSRNAVRGYLRGERLPGEYSLVDGRARPVSAALAPRVMEMLLAERAAATPRKQLLTAARIGRLLFAEGLVASESTLRSVVRWARLDVRDPLQHAFLPLVYAPGEDAQVDFFEGEVNVDVEPSHREQWIGRHATVSPQPACERRHSLQQLVVGSRRAVHGSLGQLTRRGQGPRLGSTSTSSAHEDRFLTKHHYGRLHLECG